MVLKVMMPKVVRKSIIGLLAPILLSACAVTGDPSAGVVPLAHVDLNRMYAGWYIVATIPNRLERGIVESYDVFSPGSKPGEIKEDFYMRRGGFRGEKNHFVGRIKVVSDTNDADWRVVPFWPISLPFQVVYVDPEYRYVLFGEQNREWGWIYSRTPNIPDADYTAMLEKFKSLGWDTSLFRKVIQAPNQIDAPGFWSDGITAN